LYGDLTVAPQCWQQTVKRVLVPVNLSWLQCLDNGGLIGLMCHSTRSKYTILGPELGISIIKIEDPAFHSDGPDGDKPQTIVLPHCALRLAGSPIQTIRPQILG
jgi:hypothetical protein